VRHLRSTYVAQSENVACSVSGNCSLGFVGSPSRAICQTGAAVCGSPDNGLTSKDARDIVGRSRARFAFSSTQRHFQVVF